MHGRMMLLSLVNVAAAFVGGCDDSSESVSYAYLVERAAPHERLYPGPCSSKHTLDGELVFTYTYQYDEAGRPTSALRTQLPGSSTSETTYAYDETGNLVRSASLSNGATTSLTTYTNTEEPHARRGEIYLDMETPQGEPFRVVYEVLDQDGNVVSKYDYNTAPFETATRVTHSVYVDGLLTRREEIASPDVDPRTWSTETWEYNDDGYPVHYARVLGGDEMFVKYSYSTVESVLRQGRYTVSSGRGEIYGRGTVIYDVFGNRLLSTATEGDTESVAEYSYSCFY